MTSLRVSALTALTALTALAALAPALASQSGSFTTFGTGCPGAGGTPCVSVNTSGTFSGNKGGSTNFALAVNNGSSGVLICGFRLICATRGGTQTVNTWIYDKASTGGPGQLLGNSTMTISSAVQSYESFFSNPIILQPNTDFFIAFSNSADLQLPIMSTGTSQTHWHSGPPTWKGPYSTVRWNYELVCCSSGKTPAISNTLLPTINASYGVDLSSARASSTALLAFGVQKTSINMVIIGAPSCTLYTIPLLVLGLPTDSSGTASAKLLIPNDTGLLGVKYITQYAVKDPVNSAGLAFSGGAENTIGK